MPGLGVILAHQGGWDEALVVAVPLLLFAGLLWAATRRAASHDDDGAPADHQAGRP
ncbi:MAG: hypothetical protein JWO77_561 [Ilumatobacteraceae bacterium]|nr:hypothetical protein [Ilumatobacteraceae bacterium]